jgi:hypothetical protein
MVLTREEKPERFPDFTSQSSLDAVSHFRLYHYHSVDHPERTYMNDQFIKIIIFNILNTIGSQYVYAWLDVYTWPEKFF